MPGLALRTHLPQQIGAAQSSSLWANSKNNFMRTWIKICGTTSIEDALASVQAGADALGFIFTPSPRRITAQKAQEIIRELPATVERIGVFLDDTADQIRKTVMEVDLTGIQLHGNESASEVYGQLPEDLRDALRIIKSIKVRDGFEKDLDVAMAPPGPVNAWLFDPGAGSGKTFDWKTARMQLGERQGPFILAGGLSPQNVDVAVKIFAPWGVDVVSGVEKEPGRKDHEKLKAFVTAVRKADHER
jgi:phosphoribosylanthranilate isomerase